MIVGGDVVQLVHDMQVGGQNVLNVYYFEAVDGTATLPGLASWFSTNIVPAVKNLQGPECSHEELRLQSLYNVADIYGLGLSGVGAQPYGDQGPSFLAFSIRFLHGTGGIRSGYKRIYTGWDSVIDGNVIIAQGITLMDTYGAKLVNPLTPALPTWAHVIVSRVREVDVVTGEVSYRLPETQAEGNLAYPTSFVSQPNVTTQNSRKWYT